MRCFLQIILIPAIILSLFAETHAQAGKPVPLLHIKKAGSKIIIDGELNEEDWKTAEAARDFFQNFPSDTSFAVTKTEAFVTYDDENFYVAAICYDSLKGDYIIQSLKRDFSYPISDAFAVYLDPFYDKTNGFCFTVNPLGVQREGVIEGGGAFGITTIWDNRWFSEVKRYEDRWVVEMAIPFKSIRFKEGITNWGINFSRNELKLNENSSWAAVPRNFNIGSLAHTGELIWDASPKKTGTNISLIPYAIGSTSEDFINDPERKYKPNAGMDAKIAVTSALNLDLTVNSDFSQVEVDRQVTNLTRFSLFFPERRQFFIENSDLFANFGFRQIRPFFSRRIGLYNGNQVPIITGARLSGKLDENWRIGAMNIQTAGDATLALEAQNYSVAAFQRKVFSRSNIAGIFVNRQGFRGNDMMANDYNRVIGLDYNLASANNEWFGKFFYHQSLGRNKLTDNYAHASFLLYNTRRVFLMWNHEYAGKNYSAEVGFVPHINYYDAATQQIKKLSYWRLEPHAQYSFYPLSGFINRISPGIYSDMYFDSSYSSTENLTRLYLDVNFLNSAYFNFEFNRQYTRLIFPIDITGLDSTPLPAGKYFYDNAGILFTSNQRKKFTYTAYVNYGSFYNGTKTTYSGTLSYRMRPWGIFSLNYDQNNVNLPAPYPKTNLLLIGPGMELSFTRNIFFSTILQYNTQIDNLNIYSRLQWRFKPMSDFFVVYSDNYDSAFGKKNRALVLKFVYWFTV